MQILSIICFPKNHGMWHTVSVLKFSFQLNKNENLPLEQTSACKIVSMPVNNFLQPLTFPQTKHSWARNLSPEWKVLFILKLLQQHFNIILSYSKTREKFSKCEETKYSRSEQKATPIYQSTHQHMQLSSKSNKTKKHYKNN